MFNYRFAVVAPPSHREPLAYSMAPRTVPTFVSRFTNPRPPTQNGTTPIRAEDQGHIEEAAHSPESILGDYMRHASQSSATFATPRRIEGTTHGHNA
jgi:hypothetical protein